MKITGIGSLPYLSVSKAMEWSFHCDIPYLPELIQLSAQESLIQLAYTLSQSRKIKSPLHVCYEPFLKEIKSCSGLFKVQLPGIMTAQKIIKDPLFESKYYIQNIISYLCAFEELQRPWILTLDEPLIEKDDFLKYEFFLKELRGFFPNCFFGIHICNTHAWEKITCDIFDYYFVDMILNPNINLLQIAPEKIVAGIIGTQTSEQGEPQGQIISPTCGLGTLSSQRADFVMEELLRVRNKYQSSSKSKF